MRVGILTLEFLIPGCSSLKEKRRRIRPLLARLHREFNISVAEIDQQDTWQNAVLACALVSNDNGYTQRSLQKVVRWIETCWPDLTLIDERIEIL
jgi:uncharacterized protein YlxP (DUF503 family)